MGVSIYYSAHRQTPLTDEERAAVDEVQAESNKELLDDLNERLPQWKEDGAVPSYVSGATEICEGLVLYPEPDGDEILAGSSKISHSDCEQEPMMMQLEYLMQFALGGLRRALPGAEWRVHVDGTELQWEEEYGEYSFR